jgi:subtilisin family serine protease
LLAVAAPGCVRADEYYIADGEQVELVPSERLRAFEVATEGKSDFVDRARKSPALTVVGAGAAALEKHRVVLVKIKPGEDPSSFVKDIQALALDPAVRGQVPVFAVGGIDQVLVNEFAVQFKDQVTASDIDDFLKRRGASTVALDRKISNRYLVTFPSHTPTDALRIANGFNGEAIVVFAQPNFVRIMPPGPQRMELRDQPASGDSAQLEAPNNAASCSQGTMPNDAEFHTQWALRNSASPGADICVVPAWKITVGSPEVVIAIIDTGVDVSHPDLQANVVGSYDAIDGDDDQQPNAWDGHGTACAGIAAAVGNNEIGVAGVAWHAGILAVRIAYSTEPGGERFSTDSQIEDGIRTAANRGAGVLSNSWGGGGASSMITSAIDYAISKHAVVVFGVGNDSGAVAYPASLAASRPIIAVAATNEADEFKSKLASDNESYWGSNSGPEVTIAAPGIHITTTDITGPGGYSHFDFHWNFNGTSSATPFVAGAAALLLSKKPAATPQLVREWLIKGADDLGAPGLDQQFGNGRLNVLEALKAIPSM